MHNVLKLLNLPIQFGLTILIFAFFGYLADSYWETTPIFIIAGTFAGFGLALYELVKTLSKENQK